MACVALTRRGNPRPIPCDLSEIMARRFVATYTSR